MLRSARSIGSTRSLIRRMSPAVADPERRGGHHRHALVGGCLQLPDQVVGGSGVRQQRQGALGLPVHHHLRSSAQQRGDLADHDRRLLPRPAQRSGGHHRRRDQRDQSPDHRVAHPDQRLAWPGRQRADDDRLHHRLDHQELAAVEQQRDGHRQRDHDDQLPPARADPVRQHVGEEHPDGDAERHLGHPAQPLAVGRAEADHGRDRREERRLVPEQVGRDQPGDARGDRALRDVEALGPHPGDPRTHGDPAAGDRPVEERAVVPSAIHVDRSCQTSVTSDGGSALWRSSPQGRIRPRTAVATQTARFPWWSHRSTPRPRGSCSPRTATCRCTSAVSSSSRSRRGPGAATCARCSRQMRDVDEIAPLFLKHPHRSLRTGGQLVWKDDEQFDIEHHVRHSALPKPGRVRELLDLCSRLHSTRLAWERPLWEAHVIEGLRDGRVAMYTKTHHALVDGVSAMRLLASVLSTDPDKRGMGAPWAATGPRAQQEVRGPQPLRGPDDRAADRAGHHRRGGRDAERPGQDDHQGPAQRDLGALPLRPAHDLQPEHHRLPALRRPGLADRAAARASARPPGRRSTTS